MPDPKPDITQILNHFDERAGSAEELLPLVYDQLRGIARARMSDERREHTLEATALVHEAYMRLVGDQEIRWESRAHFFRVAAEAMRRILIDHARKRNSQKRGGKRGRLPMSVVDLAVDYDTERVLEFDDALRKLEDEDARAAEIVQLRFFAGLSVAETCEAMGLSERTVMREWSFARARLFELLGPDADVDAEAEQMPSDRIKDILFDALERPPGEREQFIADACDGDEQMAGEVWRLLRSHDRAGAFLTDPEAAHEAVTLGHDTAQLSDDAVPDRIGPYRVLECIGEGGFGSVHLAEQTEPVSRQVAIKVIRPGMDSRSVVARFEAERQALAMMEHPGIARVYDAGTTEQGRPYFVMEYVDGERITDYCDTRRLMIRERLELFVGVCKAVQHAHQKGVIHRDIKPSNVLVTLVDGKPVAKVIDFGIAKAVDQPADGIDRSVLTMEGQIVGTPQYMSPEQASLDADVDTRSDVYSMGVLLYELLTGETPFEVSAISSGGIGELERRIREEEPVRPSVRVGQLGERLASIAQQRDISPGRFARELRGDLDWIVMCAIEKERARRYPTAYAFGGDIQHHLRDEAVDAGPPSRIYRISRMVRRHRGGLTIVGVVAAALVCVVVFSVIFAARADSARDRMELELARAEEATRFAQSMFQGIGPAIAKGADTTLLKSVLDQANQRVDAEIENPQVEAEMRLILGNAYLSIGENEEALTQFQTTAVHAREALGDEHPRTLDAEASAVKALMQLSRYEEALAISQYLPARYAAALGDEHPDTLSVRSDLASVHSAIGHWDQARAELETVVALRERVLGPDDRNTMISLGNLAAILVKQGDRDEAQVIFATLLERQRRLWGDDHPQTMVTVNNLAYLLNEAGRYDEAEPLMRELYERQVRILGPASSSTLTTVSNLASLLSKTGRTEEAEALYLEGLALARESLGETHMRTLTFMVNLGDHYRRTGRLDDALELQIEARDGFAAAIGPMHPNSALSALAVANTLLDLERFADAEQAVLHALELARGALPAGNWRYAAFHSTLGKALIGLGRADEAIPLMTDAYEVFLGEFGADARQTRDAAATLAELFDRLQDLERAAQWRVRADAG